MKHWPFKMPLSPVSSLPSQQRLSFFPVRPQEVGREGGDVRLEDSANGKGWIMSGNYFTWYIHARRKTPLVLKMRPLYNS